MKTLLVAVLAAVLGQTAQAESLKYPVVTILEAVTDGGFRAPGPCTAIVTSLSLDGSVVLSRDCGATAETILVLPQEKVELIKARIAKLGAVGELVRANPNAPVCNDAPFTNLHVIKNGKTILVGGRDECVEMIPSTDDSGESCTLAEIINGLHVLALRLQK
ncbi:MAG: hypothetical protein V4692_09185 [Bdellovibrionota bacterium]